MHGIRGRVFSVGRLPFASGRRLSVHLFPARPGRSAKRISRLFYFQKRHPPTRFLIWRTFVSMQIGSDRQRITSGIPARQVYVTVEVIALGLVLFAPAVCGDRSNESSRLREIRYREARPIAY
jgi:hypothetical protein